MWLRISMSVLQRSMQDHIGYKVSCISIQQLAKTNLVEFSSLVDLYEALGRLVDTNLMSSSSSCTADSSLVCKSFAVCSKKGTYHVLCAPSAVHADPSVNEKYSK